MNPENVRSIIALQRINNQLLGIIDSAKDMEDIKLKQILNALYAPYESVEPNYRDNHRFLNQYQFISSLYTYIVLPKESFFDSIPDIKTDSLKNGWGINKLSLPYDSKCPKSSKPKKCDSPCYKLKCFLRHIRNAVSHGRIEFTEQMDFTFTDIDPKSKEITFQAQLSAKELIDFNQALAYWCITQDINLTQL